MNRRDDDVVVAISLQGSREWQRKPAPNTARRMIAVDCERVAGRSRNAARQAPRDAPDIGLASVPMLNRPA